MSFTIFRCEIGVGPNRKVGARRRETWSQNFSPEKYLGREVVPLSYTFCKVIFDHQLLVVK